MYSPVFSSLISGLKSTVPMGIVRSTPSSSATPGGIGLLVLWTEKSWSSCAGRTENQALALPTTKSGSSFLKIVSLKFAFRMKIALWKNAA